MEDILEKKCKTCGALKPLTSYGKCAKARDGRMGTCHSCRHIFDYYGDLNASREERKTISARYRTVNQADYSAGKISESLRYRQAAKILPNTLTGEQWTAIKDFYNRACAYCRMQPEKIVRCRIVPVSKGGGLTARNVIPLCLSCSASKKGRIIYPIVMHNVGESKAFHHDDKPHRQASREAGGQPQNAGPS